MAGVGDDVQLRLGPGPVQGPGAGDRGDDIEPALGDPAGDVAHPVHILHDPAVLREEARVGEEPVLDPGEGDGEFGFGELVRPGVGALDADRLAFPAGPGDRATFAVGDVVTDQPLVIGAHQVAAFGFGYGGDEPFPGVREDHRGAVLIEPVQLLPGQQEDATQNQGQDALRMSDGVGHGQGRAPGPAEHHPFVDAAPFPQPLNVLDQGPGGVVFQRGVGAGLAAAALIEHDDPILGRIEIAAHAGIDGAAGSAVQHQNRPALRIAAFLVIDFVDAVGGHPA